MKQNLLQNLLLLTGCLTGLASCVPTATTVVPVASPDRMPIIKPAFRPNEDDFPAQLRNISETFFVQHEIIPG